MPDVPPPRPVSVTGGSDGIAADCAAMSHLAGRFGDVPGATSADVLSLHAADGWWGGDASAPRGLGGLTNELAAFPSLHAGWSLWVALALQIYASRKWVRTLGWLYALGTAIVIVGTGNHWVIDAIVGWLVILAGWAAAEALGRIPLERIPILRMLHRRPQDEQAVVTLAPLSPEDAVVVD